jgi:cytochrome c553
MKIRCLAAVLLWCAATALASAANRAREEFDHVLQLQPDLARGAELFAQCAACHGDDGGGATSGEVPRIAGQHYRVLVRQIIDFRLGKRWDMRMEGVATSHSAIPELQDVADVAAYVNGLERDGARGVGAGDHLDLGSAAYSARCASCHGRQGEGSAKKGIPRLAGQHANYLMRQMYDAVEGRRPPLTRTHEKMLAPLDYEQLLGLTDYLSRLGWKTQDGLPPQAPGGR